MVKSPYYSIDKKSLRLMEKIRPPPFPYFDKNPDAQPAMPASDALEVPPPPLAPDDPVYQEADWRSDVSVEFLDAMRSDLDAQRRVDLMKSMSRGPS